MASYIGIGKTAPKLAFEGDKWDNRGTFNRVERPNGCLFGQQPAEIRDFIMNELTGAQGNLLKVMWLLLSTDIGFGVSQQWVMNSTGISKDKYYDSRTILIHLNWLKYEENTPDGALLGVNYTYLWEQAKLPKEKRANTQAKIKEARQLYNLK